jgi:c-di-GMP-related signal transduction protein
VSTSIIRSKFMEQLAYAAGQHHKNAEYALIGLFSLLDALTNCPFGTLLGGLNITGEIKDILLGSDYASKPGAAYATMLAYERGEWDNTAREAEKIDLTLDDVAEAYFASLRWYNEFMKAAA